MRMFRAATAVIALASCAAPITDNGSLNTLPAYPGAKAALSHEATSTYSTGSMILRAYTTPVDVATVTAWYATHLPAQFDDLSLGEHGLFHLTIPHGGGDELVSIGRKNGTTMISLSSTR